MKPHPDDPRLSAYLLGELGAAESAEIERAAAADPAVGLALRELRAVQACLEAALRPEAVELRPLQRERVLRQARLLDHAGRPQVLPSHRRSRRALWIPLSAAAAIALGLLALQWVPSASRGLAGGPRDTDGAWDELPVEIALLPATGPARADAASGPTAAAAAATERRASDRDRALADGGGAFLRQVSERLATLPAPPPAQLPSLRPRPALSPAEAPVLDLPVHAGRASLPWISHAIRVERRLPEPNSVRLEELVNAFDLQPVGGTAEFEGALLLAECLPCPWRPSACLVLLSLRGHPERDLSLRASFHPDPANLSRYRLLGYASERGAGNGTLPSRVPAAAVTALLIEVEPRDAAASFGELRWSVDGRPAPALALARDPGRETSADARFAAFVCAAADWLGGATNGADAQIVAALAREMETLPLAEDRLDFLALVLHALDHAAVDGP